MLKKLPRVEESLDPKYIMVWAGLCSTGKTPLAFVTPGFKVNKTYDIKHILKEVLLPWSKSHFGKKTLDLSARLCTQSQGEVDPAVAEGQCSFLHSHQ